MPSPIPVTVILGVTACGKSGVAMELARRLRAAGRPAEILSIDSMQVYRRMDIGTAKPAPTDRAEVPHHLIDVVEPSETFSAARCVELADAVAADLAARGVKVLAVGGTALYLKAFTEGLFEGPSADPEVRRELHERARAEGSAALHAELARVDPESADRIHPNDLRRIVRALEVHRRTGEPISALQRQFGRRRAGYDFTFVGLRRPRTVETARINLRVRGMVHAGLIEEVRGLLNEPAGLSRQARQALGYSQVIEFVEGRMGLTRAIEQIKVATRRFAKHQRTWFRRFADVRWLDLGEDDAPGEAARQMIEAGWA